MDDKIATSAEAHEADALPRRREIHSDPAIKANTEVPASVTAQSVEKKSAAQWAYERLILYIQGFEQTLDNEHEVAMGFAGSDAGVLRIEGMGYFEPDVLTFYGSDANGAKTQLIQHVSQLSVILRALPKPAATPMPNRIGFRLAEGLTAEATTPAQPSEPAAPTEPSNPTKA